jgi:hypothetical protein
MDKLGVATLLAALAAAAPAHAQGRHSCIAREVPAELGSFVMSPSAAQRLINEIAKLSASQTMNVAGALVMLAPDVVRVLWQKPGFLCTAIYDRALYEKAHRNVFGGDA